MLWDIFLFVIGLVVLIFGGDFLVRGASSIALRFHLSPLVVGLTIVAFGTSAPELVISLKSALAGSPDLTMGNVVGSNICNLALVLGVTALIGPINVNPNSLKLDWPVTMGSSLLLFLLVQGGLISFFEGVLFVVLIVAYNFYLIRDSRRASKKVREVEIEEFDTVPSPSIWKDIGFLAIGSVGLYFGAEWFVGGAQELARFLGVSERVIGITVLALGTSLPELVTAMVAAFRQETDLALGNLLGSNIFNILSILGITSIVTEIPVSQKIIDTDMWWMLGITFLLFPMMVYKRRLTRVDGTVLLAIYLYYTYTVIAT